VSTTVVIVLNGTYGVQIHKSKPVFGRLLNFDPVIHLVIDSVINNLLIGYYFDNRLIT